MFPRPRSGDMPDITIFNFITFKLLTIAIPGMLKKYIYGVLLAITAGNVFAEETGKIPGGVTLDNPLGETSIIKIISNILDWLIIYSIPILALMILIGGFQILTAKDSPEKITSGKKTIMFAVVGFVIILISKGIALILLNIIK